VIEKIGFKDLFYHNSENDLKEEIENI